MSWEDTFRSWGAAPSKTEQEKMENAEMAIRKAIKANEELSEMDISIIPQGSYRSRTNVKQDSDVDICVCLNTTFFPRYPEGRDREYYGNLPGSISFRDFKLLVSTALGEYFGYENITSGNKAIDVHSNSYRVDADVLPAFAYRYYYGDSDDDYIQPTGVAILTNDGNRINNWPYQTYTNGVEKQENTGERYKKMVRILKRLRNKMQDENIPEANDIASFLIESLVWNVPDERFNHDAYEDDVRHVLVDSFNKTLPTGSYASMPEVNNIKLLFGAHQFWTRERANTFLSRAWAYLGFN